MQTSVALLKPVEQRQHTPAGNPAQAQAKVMLNGWDSSCSQSCENFTSTAVFYIRSADLNEALVKIVEAAGVYAG